MYLSSSHYTRTIKFGVFSFSFRDFQIKINKYENRSYNLDRIIGIRNMVDAVEVSLEGRQKSMVFSTENSLILNTIIRICSTADDPSDLGDDPEIEINFC